MDKESIEYSRKYPFVSVCTPTFNRRPFIPSMLACFNHQTYPKDRMEWIIIDDGTDKIEDLVKEHPNVKYFKYDTKLTLGKKRNLLHKKSIGDIIVYMDDDDYYPPERVTHAVETLIKNKEALCAGSSLLYIYFKHIQKMYQFGPYGPNHATAGTFAFKRKLIENTKYDDTACLAEERKFLKDYTVPFVQLDAMKTILVVSHEHNTYDKRKLLDNPHPDLVKVSDKKMEDFIKDDKLFNFFMNIDSLLDKYEPGSPTMKPDVLFQMVKIEETRRKQAEDMLRKSGGGGQINMVGTDGKTINLTNPQVVDIIQNLQKTILHQQQQLQHMKTSHETLLKENIKLQSQLSTQHATSSDIQSTPNIDVIDIQ